MGVVHEFGELSWLSCSYFIYNPKRRREAWRYITYIFLHGNHQHVAFNCIIQIIVGKKKERKKLSPTKTVF